MTVVADQGGQLARVPRWDMGELSAPEKLPNGWVRTQGRISRVGVQEYQDAAGKTVRELRLPEDVFDPASMKSFSLVPLCNTHPPVLLDDKNAKFYSIGAIGEPRRADDWLISDLMIHDAEARRDAENGRLQLSNGYECDLDPHQDPALIAKWGPYDFIQRKIRGNHCALVDVARAGPDARARMDARGDVRGAVVLASKSPGDHAMGEIRIDGLTLQVNDANVAAIQTAIDKKLADLQGLVTGAGTRADAAEGKTKRAFGLFDSLLAVVRRGKKRRDAMKARMVPCDECNGTGKVAADDGEEKNCDYCDGAGSFRMHDKMADMTSVEPESEEHGEFGADPTDDDDDMDDADELATERETEEAGGSAVGAAKAKKDAASATRRARRDARHDSAAKKAAAAKKARRDSIDRRIKRGVTARAALVETAVKLVGPDFKSAGKTDGEIRLAVIKKAWPEAKLDGKGDAYIRARYDIACEELKPIDAASLARAGAGGGAGGGGGGGGNFDAADQDPDAARKLMLTRNANVHAVKAK